MKIKGVLMVVFAASFWGLAGTFSQMMMHNERIEPAWLITVRLSVSGVFFLLWSSINRTQIFSIWMDKKDRLGMIFLGLFGFLVVQYTYFLAIQTGNAVTTSLLHFLSPLFVLFYFFIRNRTLPTIIEWTVLILASLGTFLLVTNGSLHQLTVPFISVFWGVISAIAGAFYLIYPVKMIRKWGALIVVGWGMLIGGLVMNLFSPLWHVPELKIHALFLLIYMVLFGTLFGFILYLGSLRYIHSVEAGILSCVEPLIAALSSYFLLNRSFGIYELLGGILILCTVCLITFSQHNKDKKRDQSKGNESA